MKIGYFADGIWAHRALDKIIEMPNMEICFIVARYDSADPILKQYADRLSVPYLLHQDINSESFISKIGEYCADIYVSMSFNQILKKEIIQAAPMGFINCHAGALPFYRGRNIINWALINGEKRFGVTVHYVDEGVDTGDIILQRFEDITHFDDYASLLNKAINLCSDILPEALSLIDKNAFRRIKQDSIHPVGFYCSQRCDGDEWIDWQWPSERIFNFIRAITIPGPCARTYWGDKEIAILKSDLIPNAPNYIDKPGRVVGREPDGIIVKTGDNVIKITKIAELNSDGSLGEFRQPKFRNGTNLYGKITGEINRIKRRLIEIDEFFLNDLSKDN